MNWYDDVDLHDAVGTPDAFKQRYRGAAEKAGKALGVDPDVLLGQWGLETRWGKSVIPGTNNLGNIKGDRGVAARDNATGSKDRYVKFDSPEAFADAYVDLIKRNYPKAVGAGKDSKKFAAGLSGYAEDPRYASKVSAASGAVGNTPLKRARDTQQESPDWASDIQLNPVEARATENEPQSPTTTERSTGQELIRQTGLAARAGGPYALGAAAGAAGGSMLGGIGAIPGAAAGLGAVALTDLASSVYNPIANLAGLPRMPGATEVTNRLADYVGLPKPENNTERAVQNVTSAMAGAGGTATAARLGAERLASNPVVKNALTQLGERTGIQVGSAVTSEAAREAAAESGAGPYAQLLASVAGGLAPSAAIAGGAAATRNALRGSASNIPSMLDRIQTFKDAGATRPSVGQITENRNAQALESLLSKTPGGAGQMSKRAEQQAEEIGSRVTRLADDLSASATPSVAGRVIEKGLSGPGGFVDRFKQGQKALYDKLDQYIKPQTGVRVDGTKQALAAMNENIQGAENLSRFFKNRKIQDIEAALRADTAGANSAGMSTRPANQLPYEAVKKLRTLVGEELSNGSLASDVPRSKWKALYAALSDDLESAAKSTGNPDAVKAMTRANQFSRAGYARIEDVLDKVAKQDIPEKVFTSAVNSADMQAGATKIGSIMKSLTPAERDVVKSAFIRRMGLASAGRQGAEGETFSTQTFLTNWNKMSPQAKSVMFSSEDGRLRVALDQVAKASDSIKSGSKVFANPSGTSHSTAQIGLAGGIAGAIASGQLGIAAGLLGGAAGANLTARMMTYPPFVQWLAKSTKLSPAALPSSISALQRSMKDAPSGVQEDAAGYLEALR